MTVNRIQIMKNRKEITIFRILGNSATSVVIENLLRFLLIPWKMENKKEDVK